MFKIICGILLGAVVMLPIGCSRDDMPTTPAESVAGAYDPELIAGAIVQASGWEFAPDQELPPLIGLLSDKQGPPHLRDYERTVLVGDIAHYWWEIPFGPGEHEKIRLHRVVKEQRPHRPVRTKKTLFCLHGTPGHFAAMFLVGSVVPASPEDHSLAVFLAQQDVDVWGVDQAYTLLPAEITDFSFMDGWGLQFDADNLLSGMEIARFVRRFTGSGNNRLNLLGYSTGLMTGFVALNQETQLPPGRRQIAGYIPVDNFYKTLNSAWIESDCANAELLAGVLQAGVYQNDFGVLFQMLGFLAENDPDGDSLIIPGMTNLQAALISGAQTGAVFGFPEDVHFFGGEYDGEGNLVGLQYTPVEWYLQWLQEFNNYGSNFVEYDIATIHCDEVDVPYDDYLHLIRVPVFFVGAGGGWGDLMSHTASLLGSDDITLLNIQLDPDPILDFGHVDLFTAEIAPTVFWQPVLEWINTHDHPGAPF